jgi:hypothetical protein
MFTTRRPSAESVYQTLVSQGRIGGFQPAATDRSAILVRTRSDGASTRRSGRDGIGAEVPGGDRSGTVDIPTRSAPSLAVNLLD